MTRSLFETYQGAKFCPGDDPDATFAIVEQTLARGEAAIRETLADRDRLRAAFDWDGLALQKWQALAAAWFTRHYLDRPFQGPDVAQGRRGQGRRRLSDSSRSNEGTLIG